MKLEEYRQANPDCIYNRLPVQWRERDVYQELDSRLEENRAGFTGFPCFLLVNEDGDAEVVKDADDLFGIMRTLRERKENA